MKRKAILLVIVQLFVVVAFAQLQTKKTYHWGGELYEIYTVKANTGTKQGNYKAYSESGELVNDANYVNNVLNGPYMETDGRVKRVTNYKNGEYNGSYNLYRMDGHTGKWMTEESGKYKDGEEIEMTLYNNELYGVWCKQSYKKAIAPDYKYYYYVTYYQNGNKKTEYERYNGYKYGICKTYYESGKIKSEGDFDYDKINGICKYYYESGKLKSEGNFDYGKIISYKFYQEDGSFNEYNCYIEITDDGDIQALRDTIEEKDGKFIEIVIFGFGSIEGTQYKFMKEHSFRLIGEPASDSVVVYQNYEYYSDTVKRKEMLKQVTKNYVMELFFDKSGKKKKEMDYVFDSGIFERYKRDEYWGNPGRLVFVADFDENENPINIKRYDQRGNLITK